MAKKLSDLEKKASLKALADYRGEAQKLMKDKMKKMKKVTVASDSEEGLKEGLEKAEDIIESGMEAQEMGEEYEEEMEDEEEMSEDEINAKIEELMAKKKSK